jgi:hypothetical protein
MPGPFSITFDTGSEITANQVHFSFFPQINHNSSYYSSSLLFLFFRLRITDIHFFETDSESTGSELDAFHFVSSVKSITAPRHVQIRCSESFSYCKSLSSILFANRIRIDTHRFECILILSFSQINHNCPSCSSSLFIILFKLRIADIDFI